jgi:hypothetical protein
MVYPTLLAAIGDVAHPAGAPRRSACTGCGATSATPSAPCSPASPPTPSACTDVIVAAVRAHLEYERERQVRKVRELLRLGRRFLVVGVTSLVALLSAAELTSFLPSSHFSEILREGLVITGWVAMWRPLELLLYDWWPHVEQRRIVDAVLAGEIVVVHR